MAVKFLHFADSHVGVENYGRLDPNTGLHTRLQDFIQCLRFAFEEAISQDVDLVIFSGDAYRSPDPTPTHQREFATLIRMLASNGIPIVMVTGNHDSPVAFGKATSIDIFGTLETEGVYVARKDQFFSIPTKSGPVQVACLPWLHRSYLVSETAYQSLSQEETVEALQENGARIISSLAAKVDPSYPAILAAHLAAADASLSGSEQTAIIGRDPVFLTSTLANSAFDYVALGHIHKFQDLNSAGQPPVIYPGSIERIDFGEEKEAKGVCIVTLEEQEHPVSGNPTASPSRWEATYRFIQTPARTFKTISVNVPENSDPTEAILAKIAQNDVTDAVVRIQYDVEDDQAEAIDLKAIKQALEKSFLIASIVPKPKAQLHQRRSNITEDMGVREALHAYVQNKPSLESLEEDLQTYASSLEAQLVQGVSK